MNTLKKILDYLLKHSRLFHYILGSLIGLAAFFGVESILAYYGVFIVQISIIVTFFAVAGAAAVKEMVDWLQGGRFDLLDLGATILGGVVTICIILVFL